MMEKERALQSLSELDWNDPDNKKELVSRETFTYYVIKTVSTCKYLYDPYLIGAMDVVSDQRLIKCKETFEETFKFVSDSLKLAWRLQDEKFF